MKFRISVNVPKTLIKQPLFEAIGGLCPWRNKRRIKVCVRFSSRRRCLPSLGVLSWTRAVWAELWYDLRRWNAGVRVCSDHESRAAPFPLKGQLGLELISCQLRVVLQPCCFRGPSALITASDPPWHAPDLKSLHLLKMWFCVNCLWGCQQQILFAAAAARERAGAC